jgi:photosystem II stability/assembly factor-like uncharacterized protein
MLGMAPRQFAGPQILVNLNVVDQADRQKLEVLQIPVYENNDRYILTFLSPNGIELLKKNGFCFQILDDQPFIPGEYYSVWSPKGLPFDKLWRYGQVLWQEGNRAIIKTTRLRAWRIPSLGYEIRKISTKPVAIETIDAGNEQSLFYRADTSLIQEMVNQVSLDSVRGFIESLVNFKTRYSLAPGCSLAADYIKSRFDSPRLSAAFHHYSVILTPYVYDVSAISGKEVWAVDEIGEILHTGDGGATWFCQYTEPENISLLGVEFKTPLVGWACGGDGIILKTTDGGNTWNEQTRGQCYRFWELEFVSQAQGWATGDSGRVARTTNGGTNWTIQNVGQVADLYGISFVNSTTGWVVGYSSTNGLKGLILKTTNGGTNWNVQYQDSTVVFYGVEFTDANNGWAVGMNVADYSAVIFHTINGGTSWNKQAAPLVYGLLDIDFVGPTTGWACGYGNIIHTTNGNTWTSQSPPGFETFLSTDFINADSGWVGGSSALALSTGNGGSTWNSDTVTADTMVWRNVVATITGEVQPESTCVICGHYDCTSEMPMDSAPGADDNASGTTAVLVAASILKNYRFEKTIKFIGFSGEEQGLFGSSAYAQEMADTVDFRGVLNFDMISFCSDSTFDLNVITDIRSNSLAWLLVDSLAPRYTTLAAHRVVNSSERYSDHASFWDIKVRAICAIETGYDSNPNYHTTNDVLSTLNLPFATEVVKLGVAGIAYLAGPIGRFGVGDEKPVVGDNAVRLTCTPNPFKQASGIGLSVSGKEKVSLKIYDIAGRCVKTFLNNQSLGAKAQSLTWDGRDNDGRLVSEGVYFCCLGTLDLTSTKKIVMMK